MFAIDQGGGIFEIAAPGIAPSAGKIDGVAFKQRLYIPAHVAGIGLILIRTHVKRSDHLVFVCRYELLDRGRTLFGFFNVISGDG